MPTHWLTQQRLLAAVIAGLVVCSLLPSDLVDYLARGPHVIVHTLTARPITLVASVTPDLRDDRSESIDPDLSRAQLERKWRRAYRRNRKLAHELTRLRQQMQQLQNVRARLADRGVTLVEARVAGLTGGSENVRLTIDRGRRNGIAKGQAVVSGGNLVGEVVAAGPVTADVRPIVTPGSSLSAILTPSRSVAGPGEQTAGVRQVAVRVKWNGEQGLFTAAPGADETVKVGDVALLNDQTWPATAQRAILGKVIRAEPNPRRPVLQQVRIKPLAPITQLDRVTVIVPEARLE